jgi:hypothetical protein
MKSSAYISSRVGLVFSTLLFRSETVKFLHVLLTFNSSIRNIFISYGRNFNYVKAQVFVLLTLHALSVFVIILTFEVKSYLRLFLFFLYGCISFVNKFSNRVLHKLSRATETVL